MFTKRLKGTGASVSNVTNKEREKEKKELKCTSLSTIADTNHQT